MKDKIATYIQAGYAGLYLETQEEVRAENEIKSAIETANARVRKGTSFKLFSWSITEGLLDINSGAVSQIDCPLAILDAFTGLNKHSVVILKDYHLFLREPNPMIYRKLKDAIYHGQSNSKVLIMVGCAFKFPPELEKEVTHIDFELPDKEKLRAILHNIAETTKVPIPDDDEHLVSSAMGMTTTEAENAFALSIVQTNVKNGSPTVDPVIVSSEKCHAVKKGGLLEVIESKETMDDIGGLQNLKEWVSKRRRAFSKDAESFNLPSPRGIIMVGPSGSGKSLTAKAVRAALDTILLRMDIGALKGSLVGQSEQNMRNALKTVEAIGQCVVWIDEIEKGLAGVTKGSQSLDGGSSSGMFDALLYSMQEGLKNAFFVVTSNNIQALPPEFIQRFDEVFFVDLPNASEREDVARIHIRKVGRDPKKFDLSAIAGVSDGYSGREIQKLIKEAMFDAFSEDKELSTHFIVKAAEKFIPSSKRDGKAIEDLRKWASGNARSASSPLKPDESKKTRKVSA